ncbi:unnamed protein product [Brachionus calyciflorus]|uniref:Uncharacterized protein n=1 Tax=Brachionus calyciflorus TaxID=104777 RepID=A0A814FF77_9BILA|nr:unnamed protein product [Brachionus calyciflorus]
MSEDLDVSEKKLLNKSNAKKFYDPRTKKFLCDHKNFYSLDFSFRYFEDITEIRLRSNRISKLSKDLFDGCKNLKILDLGDNELNLNEHDFDCCVNLEHLHLDFNNLKNLPFKIFSKNYSLKNLFLNNNNLKHLPKDLFKNNTCLQIVHLHNNEINTLDPEVFHNCFYLNEICLNNNFICKLPSNFFQGLKNLTHIYLNSNQIEKLDENLFVDCDNLKTLDLECNKINGLGLKLINYFHTKKCFLNIENNFDFNDTQWLFNLMFKFDKIMNLNGSRRDYFLRFYGDVYNLTRSHLDYYCPEPRVEIFKRIKCFIRKEQSDLNEILYLIHYFYLKQDYKGFSIRKIEELDQFKLSVLDFLICVFQQEISTDKLLIFKDLFDLGMRQDPRSLNLEFKFFTSEVLIGFCQRNDLVLFEKLFPMDLVRKFVNSNNTKLLDSFSNFIFVTETKKLKDFFIKIDYLSCFEILFENQNEKMMKNLLLILKMTRMLTIVDNQSYEDYINIPNIANLNESFLDEYLIEFFRNEWNDSIQLLLDNYIEENCKFINLNNEEKIKNNVEDLLIKKVETKEKELKIDFFSNENDKDILTLIKIQKNPEFLLHETTSILLNKKWRYLPRFIYFFQLALYLIFTVFYSIYGKVFISYENNKALIITSKVVCLILIIIFIKCEILKIIDLSISKNIYCYISSAKKITELLNYLICLICVFIPNKMEDKNTLFSISIFLTYVILILKLDKVSCLGSYIILFEKAFKSSIKLFAILFICMSGLMLSIRIKSIILMQQNNQINLIGLFDSLIELGSLKLSNSNEANDSGFEKLKKNMVNYSIIVMYVIIMFIIFINVLCRLSIDDIKISQAEFISNKIKYVKKFENIRQKAKNKDLLLRYFYVNITFIFENLNLCATFIMKFIDRFIFFTRDNKKINNFKKAIHQPKKKTIF